MKLGFVSAILADLSFEEVFEFADQQGYKCVETMCWPKGKAERRYAGVTHIDLDDLNETKINYIKEFISNKNVDISALGYYPNPLDPDLSHRGIYINHIKKAIKAANLLGLHNFNTFIGRDPSKSVSESIREFKKVWPEIIKYAEDFNVKVGIENCPMYFTMDEWPAGKNLATTPKIWREMFSIIPSDYFGLNYDPSHLLWMQMDYIKPIYEFKNKIFHFHIKDVKVYRDKLNEVGVMACPLEYHSPKLPGLGDIDWSKVISALYDIRFEGCVCVEIEDRSFEDSLEDRKKALVQAKNYINQFIL